jgi:lysophospholipase L1-like esterase
LGNNNKLSLETVTKIFETIKNQPQIIVVNTAVPRPWREENNKIISSVAANYANVKLIDWDRISKGKLELFAPDGVHLSPTGSDAYVAAILEVLVKPTK